MKTQLLVLEPHDDLVSVRDRMSWAKTPRILLIWSKGEGIALRPLDLKILQRHARAFGATLGLVTRDPRAQREAAALGLPVFESTRAAQQDDWPAPAKKSLRRRPRRADLRALRDAARHPEAFWRTSPVVRVGFFTLGVLAVLALAVLFLPRTEVVLSPESKIQSLTIPVVADPALDSVFIAGGIPARAMTREVAGSHEIPSTGETTIPESEAKGVARFRNLTSSAIQIPLGTVVQTLGSPPIRFVTTAPAEVPKGIGKTVDVPLESVDAGARGNLDVDLIQAIGGPLGLTLAVTNPAPATGGADRKVAAPSADDRERVRSALMASLRAQVREEMLDSLPSGGVIFPASVKDEQVFEETYDPPAGRTGGSLRLTLRVKFSAQYASGDDLLELATLALAAATEAGFSAAPDPVTFRLIGIPSTDAAGRTGFNLQVERRFLRTVDVRRVFSLVQGRRVDTALARLNDAFAFSSPPQIKMSPRWWPWISLAPFRIEVVIQ
jgi:hypothetical protein